MLFLDVEGTEEQIRKADAELEKIGYLQNNASNSSIVLIEPACGSNTAVIKSFGKILCIDSGYACYAGEMRGVLRSVIPEYDAIPTDLLRSRRNTTDTLQSL